MNWMSKMPPGIRNLFKRNTSPTNFWVKCPLTGQLVSHIEVEENQFVIPDSGYHLQIEPKARFVHLFDNGVWEALPLPKGVDDPLRFRDAKRYVDRLKDARKATGNVDAIVLGVGQIGGTLFVVAAHDFRFIGGSLGTAAGDAIVAGILEAIKRHSPFVVFAASGGARMQESIFSLIQMPRTTIAVQRLREAGLPFIVVLTNPTMGGVTASYAMLGDIHIAEPGALIGFAGKDIIWQIAKEDMPDEMRRAEQALKHGMVDMVVHRHNIPGTLARLGRLLLKSPAVAA